MAYTNLSDITGVPVLMPVMREVVPTISFQNNAGLTVDTSLFKFYRMGRKLIGSGQFSFTGTGTDTGIFRIYLDGVAYPRANSCSAELYTVSVSGAQPGSFTFDSSGGFFYFKKNTDHSSKALMFFIL